MKAILQYRPDLLFLDIQLKEKDSMWLLKQLKDAITLPYIIFTTAYDTPEYLLKAIKFAQWITYSNRLISSTCRQQSKKYATA